MPKWKETGYVPDSDDSDELWSSQSQQSFHPTPVLHGGLPSLRNGKLDTPGGHEDGRLEFPKILEEERKDESCDAQNTLACYSYR